MSGLCYGNLSAAYDVDAVAGPSDWLQGSAPSGAAPVRPWLPTVSLDLVTAPGINAHSDATTRFQDQVTGTTMKCAMILPIAVAAHYQRHGHCVYARWRGSEQSPAAEPAPTGTTDWPDALGGSSAGFRQSEDTEGVCYIKFPAQTNDYDLMRCSQDMQGPNDGS